MVPPAPASPLSRLLGDRLSQLTAEAETLFAEACAEARAKGRQDIADQLNQAVRRLRQSADLEGLGATLVDAAGAYASGAALFVIEDEKAHGRRIRGVEEETAN